MALFGKDKKEGMPSKPPPLNQQVGDMKAQGMNANQISQNLQRDGYNYGQIGDAMNQQNMNLGVPGQYPGQQPPSMGAPPPMSAPPPMDGGPSGQSYSPSGQVQNMGFDESSLNNAQFEEVAESIIEEKWNDLMKNVNKIIEWKNQMDSRFVQVEQKFDDLQHNFDELHKAVISKINEYDQNILNVGSQVKAMEKVFSKVLPTFTDTVGELGRITNFVKGGKAPKKRAEEPNDDDDSDDDTEIPHELLHNL